MIFQFGNSQIDFIVWLIVGTIILGLFINLSVRFIVSKTKASDKKLMAFLVAFLGLFLIPIIAGAIGMILTAIGSLPAMLPWGGNYMGLLVPVVQYLLFLITVKFLLDEDWGDATWISLIAMFLLFFLYSCFPVLYTFIGSVI
ncbi:MAG: hypothetical protein GY870_00625 [archaeon]|nr:hypothetical protein [archaeon]